MASEVKRYPGQSDEAFPDVFTRPPAPPVTCKPGQLNEQQFRQYFEEVKIIQLQGYYGSFVHCQHILKVEYVALPDIIIVSHGCILP